ncbi:MAG: hypothetical protein ANABAC_3398 [Anaerolineae bacterium]|nr:MAG: hypothetical protein ANABAC_3398 [Anaerolineae bacterium]
MNRKKILILALVIAMFAVVGIGAFTYTSVRAQAQDPSPLAWGGGRPFGGRLGKGPDFAKDGEALAQALGISVEELQAAQQKAQEAALQKAVEEGLITEKQAELFGSGERGFPLGGRLFAWLSQNGINLDALLAEALGISVEELNEARQEAVQIAIDQAVADGRLTQEQADLMKARRALFANQNFINAMRSAFEAAVKKAVEEGVITQAQADLILERLQSQSDSEGSAFPPFFGGFGEGMPLFPPRGGGWGH